MNFKKTYIVVVVLLLSLLSSANVYAVLSDTVGPAGAPKVTQPGSSNSSGSGGVFSPSVVTGGKGTSGPFRSIQDVGRALIDFIIKTIVPLTIAIALLTFLLGILKFMRNAEDTKEREAGRQFMLFGIIGLAVMVSVWGLVQILTNTLGQPLVLPSLNQLNGR